MLRLSPPQPGIKADQSGMQWTVIAHRTFLSHLFSLGGLGSTTTYPRFNVKLASLIPGRAIKAFTCIIESHPEVKKKNKLRPPEQGLTELPGFGQEPPWKALT